MNEYRLARVMVFGNVIVAGFIALYFFLIPMFIVVQTLNEPALSTGDIPSHAWRIHKALTPRIDTWARDRVASGIAADVGTFNVPDTEWPPFTCVFFLWATVNLQEAWEADPSLSKAAPKVYARDTIEACKDLLLDPNHHTFVKTHWGDDYMHTENVFFRSLIIAGLTSYEKLTESGETLDILRDQVETLSAELDASPHGVLHDYPHECYPMDVLPAIAWIRRADEVLDTDHSAFVDRSRRAFTGDALDDEGLIPWQVDPVTGRQYEGSRGIVMSHALIFAPEIYPDLAEVWVHRYEKNFWQELDWASGFRELYRDDHRGEWAYLVDSGPLIDGFSPGASAFGVGMARANGRMDIAYTLSAMMIAASWPLPNGRLMGGQALSITDHAPYLGESAILWMFTTTPLGETSSPKEGKIVSAVYWGIAFCIVMAIFTMVPSIAGVLRLFSEREYYAATIQFAVWILILAVTTIMILNDNTRYAVGIALITQLIPRSYKVKE